MEHIESKLIKKKKRLKKYIKNTPDTIEQIHNSKMVYFKELQDVILPEKQKKLQKYKNDLVDKNESLKNIRPFMTPN